MDSLAVRAMSDDDKPLLRVVPFEAGKPDKELVEMLEQTLQKARAGEIVAACIVFETRVDGTHWGAVLCAGNHPEALIGQIETMKHRLLYDFARAEDE